MTKKFYAGKSYMGTNYTFDSRCWVAYMFDSKAERDAWVDANEYDDRGNRVAQAISRRQAHKILGGVGKCDDVVYDYYNNDGRITIV